MKKLFTILSLLFASVCFSQTYPARPIAEAGLPDFDASFFFGLAVPAGTPRDMIAKFAAESARIVNAAEFREKYLNNLGFEPVGDAPEQFAAFLRQDRALAEKKVKASGAKLD